MNNYEIVKKLSLNQKAALLSGKNTWKLITLMKNQSPLYFYQMVLMG